MKQVAVLLSFAVIFLAFKPGLDSFMTSCHEVVTCCTDSCDIFDSVENEGSSNSDDGCNGNSCNPFLSCSSSFIVVTPKLVKSVDGLLIPREMNFTYQFNLKSILVEKLWHPPKVV